MRRFHGTSASSAPARSSAPIRLSAVFPLRNGASQSAALRASASSDKSGQLAPTQVGYSRLGHRIPISGKPEIGAAEEPDAVAQLPLRLAPRQLADAERGDAFGQQPRAVGIGRDRFDLLGQHQRAEAAAAARAQRGGVGVEDDSVTLLDLVGEARLDVGERNRRRQHDATGRRRTAQFGYRQQWLARQR